MNAGTFAHPGVAFLTDNQTAVLLAVTAEPAGDAERLAKISGLRQTAVARALVALRSRGLVDVDDAKCYTIHSTSKENPMGTTKGTAEAVEACPECGSKELFATTADTVDGTFYAECECGWEGLARQAVGRATPSVERATPSVERERRQPADKRGRFAGRDELSGTTVTAWASSLTDDRIAADLQRLAKDVRFHTGAERAALLNEAARRIGGAR